MRITDVLYNQDQRVNAIMAGRMGATGAVGAMGAVSLRVSALAGIPPVQENTRTVQRDRTAWSWNEPFTTNSLGEQLVYTKAAAQVTGENAAVSAQSGGIGGAEEGAGLSGLLEVPTECKTCGSRQYKDESGDAGVSFQAATGLPASTAGSRVAAHEGEHVTRETARAEEEDAVVIQQKVTMQMAICPECGRTYAAGGETTIQTAPGHSRALGAYAWQQSAVGLLLDAAA